MTDQGIGAKPGVIGGDQEEEDGIVDTDSFRNIRTRLISMICGVCKII
jgi:hypothetical protein